MHPNSLDPNSDIENELNTRNVPGTGVTWKRIYEFAENFHLYKDVLDLLPQNVDYKLSRDQEMAWKRLEEWATSSKSAFILRGYAGTGKTFLLQKLASLNLDVYFTAPTNKATKVLSRATKSPAKTTYSQLGIRMQQDEDKLTLTFGDKPPYLPANSILVVDEASMVGEELYGFIRKVVKKTRCKVLFVGDPAQLPPVGEPFTKAWKATTDSDNRAFMRQVMRFDNQLLKLATKIRERLIDKKYVSPLKNDNDEYEGVFKLPQKDFEKLIDKHTEPKDWLTTKVIAWRNKTVNHYNNRIRTNFGFTAPFEIGDVVLMAEPVEMHGQIIAAIDDEYVIEDVDSSKERVWMDEVKEGVTLVDVWVLKLRDDENQTLTIRVAKNQADVDFILSQKAKIARDADSKDRREAWKDFWATKALFSKVRYGYALTAHRAQGSTYSNVFVDQQDILANSNQAEAMRCLYVACTRASHAVYSF